MTDREINELAKEIHQINLDNGFGVNIVSDEHCYMLIITEVAEMVEADRKDKYANTNDFEDAIESIKEEWPDETKDYSFKYSFEAKIKDTVEDEFADIMIRLLDFIALRDIKYEELNCETLDYYEILGYENSELGYLIVHALMYESIRFTIQLVIEIAEGLDIDLWWHVRQKMRYNKLRGYKHGNKKY